MLIINLLLINCLSVTSDGSLEVDFRNQEVCDSIEVSYEAETSENSKSKVTVSVKGGAAPFKYIFYNERGDLLSNEFDSNWVEGLAKGRYLCTVLDNYNCRKTIEIEIN